MKAISPAQPFRFPRRQAVVRCPGPGTNQLYSLTFPVSRGAGVFRKCSAMRIYWKGGWTFNGDSRTVARSRKRSPWRWHRILKVTALKNWRTNWEWRKRRLALILPGLRGRVKPLEDNGSVICYSQFPTYIGTGRRDEPPLFACRRRYRNRGLRVCFRRPSWNRSWYVLNHQLATLLFLAFALLRFFTGRHVDYFL